MREGGKEGRREDCDAAGKCERDDDDDDDDDAQAKIGFICCSNKANLQFANFWYASWSSLQAQILGSASSKYAF